MSEASATPEGSSSAAADRSVPPEERPLPPGPDELPVIGSTFDLMRRPIEFLDAVSAYGDVVTYHVAGQRFTALLHPDHVERVLLHENERFRRWSGEEWGDAFGGYASEGLLLSEGEQWRRQRLLIQNAFTPERIESYADTMVAEAERAIEEWAASGRIDLKEATSRLTLRVLARTLFDLDLEGRGEAIRRAAETLNARANTFHLSAFLPNWVPTPANRRLDRAMGDLEAVLDDLIEERRADAAGREDLLSLLLAAEGGDGPALSEAEVRDQLITFLFAGHETTSLALTYALHSLAHHPDRLARLREEVEAVTGGEPPTLADLPELAYTGNVIRETLRRYPPAYAIFREALEDVEIGGYRVPRGSKVSLPQIHVHRDERFYDAPEEFRPERWSDGLEDDLPEYAYFPFGGGPRHCIGMRFATMELKHVLPTIVSALDFDPLTGPDLELETAITLQPANSIDVRVNER